MFLYGNACITRGGFRVFAAYRTTFSSCSLHRPLTCTRAILIVPSVVVDSPIRDKFGYGTIIVDGVKHYGQVWPIRMFMTRFMLDEDNKPNSQEDWRAVVWHYGGPKPSQCGKVDVKMTDDKSMMVILWTEKSASSTEPE